MSGENPATLWRLTRKGIQWRGSLPGCCLLFLGCCLVLLGCCCLLLLKNCLHFGECQVVVAIFGIFASEIRKKSHAGHDRPHMGRTICVWMSVRFIGADKSYTRERKSIFDFSNEIYASFVNVRTHVIRFVSHLFAIFFGRRTQTKVLLVLLIAVRIGSVTRKPRLGGEWGSRG